MRGADGAAAVTQPARAVILAAGRGRRLRPLTDRAPKCLVRLGGRTLLSWQRAALRRVDVSDVAIVAGYARTRLRRRGIVELRNRDWARSSMVASLLCAREWLRTTPVLVAYGDIVYHPTVAAALLATDHDIALVYDRQWRALWSARFARPEDDAESFHAAGGVLRGIGAPITHPRRVHGQYIGLVRFTPHGWRRAERLLASLDAATVRTLETTQLLSRLLDAGVTIGAIPVDGRWCEVDTLDDVALYEARLAAGAPWTHDWRFSCS